MKNLITHLGKIGSELPELKEKEWEQIFQFIEFFLTTENRECNFNWSKVMEVLILLKRIK